MKFNFSILPQSIGHKIGELIFGAPKTAEAIVSQAANSQPEELTKVHINLWGTANDTALAADGSAQKEYIGKIEISCADLITLYEANKENFPKGTLKLQLKEVSVCELTDENDPDSSIEKKMVILASQTYLPIPEE